MQVHQIQNNNCNTTSFRAKLSLELVKGSEARWQKIANEFERITKKYPNSKYEFIPKGSLSNGLDLHLSINESWPIATTVLKPKMTKLMAKMSDTEIANKLKKLFALWVELGKIHDQCDDIEYKLFNFNYNHDDNINDVNMGVDAAHYNYNYAVFVGLENRALVKLKKDTFFNKMIDCINFPYFIDKPKG